MVPWGAASLGEQQGARAGVARTVLRSSMLFDPSRLRSSPAGPAVPLLAQHAMFRNHAVAVASLAAQRWLAIRLDAASAALLGATALVGVLANGSISAGLIGVALSEGLQVVEIFQCAVRQAAKLGACCVGRVRVLDGQDGACAFVFRALEYCSKVLLTIPPHPRMPPSLPCLRDAVQIQ